MARFGNSATQSYEPMLEHDGLSASMLVSLPSGHNVANVLRSGVLAAVQAQAPHLRTTIVSPFADDDRFREEFSSPMLAHEPLAAYRPSAAERIIESIVSEQFLSSSGLTAVRLQRDRARLLEPWQGRRLAAAAKDAISRLPVPRRVWFGVAQAMASDRGCGALFDRHRPSLLVTSTAGFLDAEMPLLWEARRRGVPCMAIDLGWDNLSSKYHTIRPVDYLTVWNESMKEEAVRYHGFPASRVFVTGAVQFDQYRHRQRLPSRSAFFKAINADEACKLITLATPATASYASTSAVADTLARVVRQSAFGQAVHLLVRVHPRDGIEAYAALRHVSRVTVEKPMARLDVVDAVTPTDAFSPTSPQRLHLAATLEYSDVIVNCASTTTLEACMFDTPVINIGFDSEPDLPLPLSVRRYYHYEHYRPVVEAGAVRIADDPDSLVRMVRDYLADPSRDREARRRVVEQMCSPGDGRAAERMARAVLTALGASTRAAAA